MDLLIFQAINQWANHWIYLDILAIFFAQYSGYVLVFLLLVFLLTNWRQHWRGVVFSFLSAILARFVLVELIRQLWARPRPFLVAEVNLLIDKTNQAAFPSGHAAFYFALSFFFFLYLRKTYPHSKFWLGVGLGFLIGAALMSLARVFVGLHWPSDILAGAGLGFLVAGLVNFFFLKFNLNQKKIL